MRKIAIVIVACIVLPLVLFADPPALSYHFKNITTNLLGYDWVAQPVMREIRGVVCYEGVGLDGVLIEAEGLTKENRAYSTTATTYVDGAYIIYVPHGWSGSLSPYKEGYIFQATTCPPAASAPADPLPEPRR